jgi:glyoxylase-like metal-dependent hydrolase (beta-lactamase superfamily II)
VTVAADGDNISGLGVIATPGHTPGSISLLDPAGVLVAGDALTGANGGIAGPNPQFTPDTETANQSVIKLAGFSYEVVYVGHGDPVLSGGSAQVSELADSL